jgi:hypothetical protein
VKPNRPWISAATLDLIHQRFDARTQEDWLLEKDLKRETRKSARRDRSRWLQDLAGKGDWQSLRKLQREKKDTQTRLQDAQGNIVSSEARANTLADHLEQIQWGVRPITLQPDPPPPIFQKLPIEEGLFTHIELRKAIRRLASGKATQHGDLPIEIFKAMANACGETLQTFLDLINMCWCHGSMPRAWVTAKVAMIYKKGDPALCDSYRPICLTLVAYRIYASMIKQRLLDAGLDARLWGSQFGFRKGHSTEDAMYVARRHIELACARRNGQVNLLALDWAKAFDSVHSGRLLQCLRRFGICGKTLQAIDGLMSSRPFFVGDSQQTSTLRAQSYGISQGCTLSPLLFIVVMSAVMHDAVKLLSPPAREAYEKGALADIVYADDTLLIGASAKHVQEFLRAVAAAGRTFGLQLHEGKFRDHQGLKGPKDQGGMQPHISRRRLSIRRTSGL